MASETVADLKDVPVNDDNYSPEHQSLEDVENKMVTLSDRVNLCATILDDLNDLKELLVRKSLQDVSLPQQK